MGSILKLVDPTLFVFFVIIALAVPLIDAQMFLPLSLFPKILIELNTWYVGLIGHYLVMEKPHFFVGMAFFELLFHWPLAIANLYGIWAAKSWVNTTCLTYGVSFFTFVVIVMSELVQSGKGSDKLLFFYLPFLGFSILAILRGLLPLSGPKTSRNGKRPPLAGRKKKAQLRLKKL